MNKLFQTLGLSLIFLSSYAAPQSVDPVETIADLMKGHVSEQQAFNQAIKKNPIVIVKCSKERCPPCKIAAPLFSQLARKYQGKALFIALDVETYKSYEVVRPYGIKSVPAFLIFSKGLLIKKSVGLEALDEIPTIIDPLL